MDQLQQLAQSIIQWSALLLLFFLGVGMLWIFVLYLVDKTQKIQDAKNTHHSP